MAKLSWIERRAEGRQRLLTVARKTDSAAPTDPAQVLFTKGLAKHARQDSNLQPAG